MPKPEESSRRFHREATSARRKRLSAALMDRLWQDGHFAEGFMAEAMQDRLAEGIAATIRREQRS